MDQNDGEDNDSAKDSVEGKTGVPAGVQDGGEEQTDLVDGEPNVTDA